MHLVALGWIYVALMMALAEATSPTGTVLGATFTFVLYGVMPLAIMMYVMGTPSRRRKRHAAEATAANSGSGQDDGALSAAWTISGDSPDQGSHASGEAVAPERKEP